MGKREIEGLISHRKEFSKSFLLYTLTGSISHFLDFPLSYDFPQKNVSTVQTMRGTRPGKTGIRRVKTPHLHTMHCGVSTPDSDCYWPIGTSTFSIVFPF